MDAVTRSMERRREMKDKICGTCRYSKPDPTDWMGEDFFCTNSDSDYWSDYCEYADSCENWEDKDDGD